MSVGERRNIYLPGHFEAASLIERLFLGIEAPAANQRELVRQVICHSLLLARGLTSSEDISWMMKTFFLSSIR
jgi:hypothetical protein